MDLSSIEVGCLTPAAAGLARERESGSDWPSGEAAIRNVQADSACCPQDGRPSCQFASQSSPRQSYVRILWRAVRRSPPLRLPGSAKDEFHRSTSICRWCCRRRPRRHDAIGQPNSCQSIVCDGRHRPLGRPNPSRVGSGSGLASSADRARRIGSSKAPSPICHSRQPPAAQPVTKPTIGSEVDEPCRAHRRVSREGRRRPPRRRR